MKKFNTRMIVEAGVLIALAQILSYIKVFEMPQGGSITAGSLVPIVLFGVKWGALPGVTVGAVYGLLQFILGPKWSYHILSILFDYVFAFGFIGLAGIFGKELKNIFAGLLLSTAGRYICHVISGAIVFASYAPEGQNPWVYSLIYNITYVLPEFAATFLLVGVLYRYVKRHIQGVQ